jgi:predicted nucleic acid-binding protein
VARIRRVFSALSIVIEHYQRGGIDLCTSTEAKKEVAQIPDEYERDRTAILRVFSLIRLASVVTSDPDIEAGLPPALDHNDRAHVAQAIAAGARYFLTPDQGILRLRDQIQNIDILKPSELAQRLGLTAK